MARVPYLLHLGLSRPRSGSSTSIERRHVTLRRGLDLGKNEAIIFADSPLANQGVMRLNNLQELSPPDGVPYVVPCRNPVFIAHLDYGFPALVTQSLACLKVKK